MSVKLRTLAFGLFPDLVGGAAGEALHMVTQRPNKARQPMPVGRHDCSRSPLARHGCAFRSGYVSSLRSPRALREVWVYRAEEQSAQRLRREIDAKSRSWRWWRSMGVEGLVGQFTARNSAPNQAAPVNAPGASRFHAGHAWRRVTEHRR